LLVAEEEPVLRVKMENPQPAEKNRIGVSYKMSFNITAEFKNVGNVGTGSGGGNGHGPATGGGIDRSYDDGYNRVDSSGNKDGLTWFWGYKNQSQVVGDTLVMRSTSIAPINSKTIDGDPQNGAELTYNRELGRWEKNNRSWGLEAGLAWTDIDITDHRPLKGGIRTIADAYDLGGVNPNVAPQSSEYPGHAGTFQGPGPLIDDSPTRTVTSSAKGSLVLGERHFEANLFAFRLGPYVDLPIDDKWTFSLSAGPVLGVVDGEFSYRQLVRTGGVSKFQADSGSKTDMVFGGYVSGTIRYAIDEHWGVFVGGQYMGLTDYDTKAGGQKVEIDFARTASATFGVSFLF
jgi:hypothetical protein